jgi:hypothetical protein
MSESEQKRRVPLSAEDRERMQYLGRAARSALREMGAIIERALGNKLSGEASPGFRLTPKGDRPQSFTDDDDEPLTGVWETCPGNTGCGCYDFDRGLCYEKPC